MLIISACIRYVDGYCGLFRLYRSRDVLLYRCGRRAYAITQQVRPVTATEGMDGAAGALFCLITMESVHQLSRVGKTTLEMFCRGSTFTVQITMRLGNIPYRTGNWWSRAYRYYVKNRKTSSKNRVETFCAMEELPRFYVLRFISYYDGM